MTKSRHNHVVTSNATHLNTKIKAVWDALEPRSCDTHSTSYSATRETFLKLLRPGVDYREAFHKVGVTDDIGRWIPHARGQGVQHNILKLNCVRAPKIYYGWFFTDYSPQSWNLRPEEEIESKKKHTQRT